MNSLNCSNVKQQIWIYASIFCYLEVIVHFFAGVGVKSIMDFPQLDVRLFLNSM